MKLDMVHITDDLFLGKGGHRACYRHPDDQSKCIKIILNPDGKRTVDFELDFYVPSTKEAIFHV